MNKQTQATTSYRINKNYTQQGLQSHKKVKSMDTNIAFLPLL